MRRCLCLQHPVARPPSRTFTAYCAPEGTKHTIVFVRHGESTWNAKKRFSGWCDVDLTDKGRHQALMGGYKLRAAGFCEFTFMSPALAPASKANARHRRFDSVLCTFPLTPRLRPDCLSLPRPQHLTRLTHPC
mmetsp:Transcript_17777/g.46525  ORF Transcript_17777/g.46525 Transcript_17777/m.46525 type:complete len:133 (+) Transcript_17777:78-476(+)